MIPALCPDFVFNSKIGYLVRRQFFHNIITLKFNVFLLFFIFSVRKQVVNIPSFIVRLDSQKHIDFSLKSPFGGGRPGRVKRKNMRKGAGGGAAEEEED